MSDRSRTFPWGRLVLGLSLALNLVIIGIVAGAFWRFGKDHDHAARRGAGAFAAPYVLALPRDDRHALREALQAQGPNDRRAARRASYEAVLAALRAEPFDSDALAAALKRQREAAIAGQLAAETAWLRQIETMDRETRADYADRVERILDRKRRRSR